MTKKEQLNKNTVKVEKPKRLKKCHYCQERKVPYGDMRTFCFDNACIKAHNEKTKKQEKRKAVAKFKESDKSTLMQECQKIANKIGKLHAYLSGVTICATCPIELSTQQQVDGGHGFPTSTYSGIRFYTLQILPQCVKCNRYNSGMRVEFKNKLISMYGEEKVEWFESFKGKPTKYTVEYLRKYKRVMGSRLKKLEKRL